MAEIVYMPKLSDTMTEGVVASWLKKVGEEVKEGEILAEIETDKATMEFESFYDGVLLHIGIEQGKSAPVNSILAVIGDAGEDIKSILANANSSNEEIKENKEPAVEEKKVEPVENKTTEAPVQKVSTTTSNNNKRDGERIFASPLAKKLANEKGYNLDQIQGTGENGRIVKRDVDHYVPYIGASNVLSTQTTTNSTESFVDEPISQMRKTIARRLAESKFTAPHFYLNMEIDMDNAISARKSLNAIENVKVSFNDLVIKAVSMALKKHRAVNSAWLGDVIRRNNHVNIGVAVAVDEGLLVPVIRHADQKGLMQISSEVKEFAQKAKDKKLQPSDWEGNTFTISNLGMFGIDSFTAIVNPPDSCILAIGGINEVPVVRNGQIVPGNIMKVTLSCDHRVVDGALGAAFLQTFKMFMEHPASMLL